MERPTLSFPSTPIESGKIVHPKLSFILPSLNSAYWRLLHFSQHKPFSKPSKSNAHYMLRFGLIAFRTRIGLFIFGLMSV